MSDEEDKLKRIAAQRQQQQIRERKNVEAGREPTAPSGRKAHQARQKKGIRLGNRL